MKELIIKVDDPGERVWDGNPKTFEIQELIRCKDCQFNYVGENEVDAWDRCRLHSINTEPDNYCSWAVVRGKG